MLYKNYTIETLIDKLNEEITSLGIPEDYFIIRKASSWSEDYIGVYIKKYSEYHFELLNYKVDTRLQVFKTANAFPQEYVEFWEKMKRYINNFKDEIINGDIPDIFCIKYHLLLTVNNTTLSISEYVTQIDNKDSNVLFEILDEDGYTKHKHSIRSIPKLVNLFKVIYDFLENDFKKKMEDAMNAPIVPQDDYDFILKYYEDKFKKISKIIDFSNLVNGVDENDINFFKRVPYKNADAITENYTIETYPYKFNDKEIREVLDSGKIFEVFFKKEYLYKFFDIKQSWYLRLKKANDSNDPNNSNSYQISFRKKSFANKINHFYDLISYGYKGSNFKFFLRIKEEFLEYILKHSNNKTSNSPHKTLLNPNRFFEGFYLDFISISYYETTENLKDKETGEPFSFNVLQVLADSNVNRFYNAIYSNLNFFNRLNYFNVQNDKAINIPLIKMFLKNTKVVLTPEYDMAYDEKILSLCSPYLKNRAILRFLRERVGEPIEIRSFGGSSENLEDIVQIRLEERVPLRYVCRSYDADRQSTSYMKTIANESFVYIEYRKLLKNLTLSLKKIKDGLIKKIKKLKIKN